MWDGIGYEYASKMQASNCFFYAFHVSTHFLHHIFSKLLFLLGRGTHFCKTTSSDFNQKFHLFDPQTASIRPFLVIQFALFSLLAVPIAIFSLRARIKILLLAAVPCIFAPRAPSAKISVCIDATILSISYTICCFLCAFHASSTFFYKISSYFLKICSPPSVGNMILKAAQKQNHEKFAS